MPLPRIAYHLHAHPFIDVWELFVVVLVVAIYIVHTWWNFGHELKKNFFPFALHSHKSPFLHLQIFNPHPLCPPVPRSLCAVHSAVMIHFSTPRFQAVHYSL